MPGRHIEGVEGSIAPHILNLSTRWRWGSASCHDHLTLRIRSPGVNWIGGWVDPRASVDVVVKRNNPIIVAAGNW